MRFKQSTMHSSQFTIERKSIILKELKDLGVLVEVGGRCE